VSRRAWWSAWCAHLEPSPPPVVAADLLGAADSQLSFLGMYKSAPLETAYREHRYFCCARRARWAMVVACLVFVIIAAAQIPDDMRLWGAPPGQRAAVAVMLSVVVLGGTAFTFTPFFGPASLQPTFFLGGLAFVLLFTGTDLIFGVEIRELCGSEVRQLNQSLGDLCNEMCESGMTVKQTNAGRTIWHASQYDLFQVLFLFFFPVDAPLAIFLACLHAVLNEALLQQHFDFTLRGSIIAHSFQLVVFGIASVIKCRSARHTFLTNARLATALDRRIEQLNSEKERVEWEREMEARDKARAAYVGSAPPLTAPSSDGRVDRMPSNMFRPCTALHSTSNTPSDAGSHFQSSLRSLPYAWPQRRLDEPYPGEDRPACYPTEAIRPASRCQGARKAALRPPRSAIGLLVRKRAARPRPASTSSPSVSATAVSASPSVSATAVSASPSVSATAVSASPSASATAVSASPSASATAVSASPSAC